MSLEGLLLFFYWFGPLWIYAIYKIAQMLHLGVESIISNLILILVAQFTVAELSNMLGASLGLYNEILGYWALVWPTMFWIGLVILHYRGYYSFSSTILLSFLATVSALAVWEIPIHVLTIYLHPTLYQVVLTTMLAFPTGIMIIPFRIETRYDMTFRKPWPRYWKRYLEVVVGRPILIGLALIALDFFDAKGGLMDSIGYPIEFFQMVLRIGFAGVFLEYLWHTPRRKILARYPSGYVAKEQEIIRTKP